MVSALFVEDLVTDLLGNILALHVGPHAALLQLDALTLLSGCPPGNVARLISLNLDCQASGLQQVNIVSSKDFANTKSS